MLYKCADDFFKYAATVKRISREEEKELGLKMKEGDEEAKEALITSYLPVLASYLKRNSREPSLAFIYSGLVVLSDSVQNFNFQVENPTFTKFLGYKIRRMVTRFIADNPIYDIKKTD